MKYISIVLILALVGCNENQAAPVKNLSYQELVNFPFDCRYAEQQLAMLKDLQKLKNYDSDPDKLTEYARSYNGRLKASIWWYSYNCAKS